MTQSRCPTSAKVLWPPGLTLPGVNSGGDPAGQALTGSVSRSGHQPEALGLPGHLSTINPHLLGFLFLHSKPVVSGLVCLLFFEKNIPNNNNKTFQSLPSSRAINNGHKTNHTGNGEAPPFIPASQCPSGLPSPGKLEGERLLGFRADSLPSNLPTIIRVTPTADC